MNSDGAESNYDIMEVFIIKFVLADIVIIAALLLAGPLYAVAITALLIVSVFLTWYLTQRIRSGTTNDSDPEPDPITELQERYAAGELSDAEFEAALDRLIDANERAGRAGIETEELSIERSN